MAATALLADEKAKAVRGLDRRPRRGTAPDPALDRVRNYQARNFMRDPDDMRLGDGVLFYHSSCPQPGIAGLAEVASSAYPDATQFVLRAYYPGPRRTRRAGCTST